MTRARSWICSGRLPIGEVDLAVPRMPLLLLLAAVCVVYWMVVAVPRGKRRATASHAARTVMNSAMALAVLIGSFRAGVPWVALIAGAAWLAIRNRKSEQAPRPATNLDGRGEPSMTSREAYALLGLPDGASRDEIKARYRQLIRSVHPDHGGTDYLASRVNQARDTLLGKGEQR